MINYDEIHLLKAKRKAQLRIKDHLGQFIYNNRKAGKEAEEILEGMKLKKSFIWPYDPHRFIYNIWQKHKLSPYIHHRIPEIEQYANNNEWVEGTLIEQDSTHVEVENVMKDLERRLALDSFVQVLGESSERPTQKHSAQTLGQPEKFVHQPRAKRIRSKAHISIKFWKLFTGRKSFCFSAGSTQLSP